MKGLLSSRISLKIVKLFWGTHAQVNLTELLGVLVCYSPCVELAVEEFQFCLDFTHGVVVIIY